MHTEIHLCILALLLLLLLLPLTHPLCCFLWLTHTGDPLGDQVLQQSIDDRVVSGVQLVSINPNVEAEPVGVGVGAQLPCGAELISISFSIPGQDEEEEEKG